jgi:hypothetical protein
MTMRLRAQMPGDQTPPPRARGWGVGVAGVIFLVVNFGYEAIEHSGVPNGYLGRNWDIAVRGPWPYPTELVRNCLIIMGLDALFGVWFLQRRSTTSLPVRSLTFAALNLLGMVLMVPMMMHAGAPFGEMLLWLFFATCWGVLFAIIARVANAPPKKPT